MAIKLFAEFQSDQGQYYKIAIHDEDYSGSSPDEFKVTSGGFQLTYSGETDNIYSPIIGSSVSFGMYVQDSATTAFVSNFKSVQEDRYFVEIFDGTESSPTLFWRGFIVQDIVSIEDAPQPFVLEIQATDGLARLRNETCPESSVQQISVQFIKALNAVNVLDLFGTNDVVLNVVCNWWSESTTYNVNNNPLDETFLDMRTFGTTTETGIFEGTTWGEVLSKICTIFGLRFYFSKGQYRLEQLFALDGTFTEHTYKKAFTTGAGNKLATKIGQTTGVSHTQTIDQTSNQARLAGNIFNFLPAVQRVSLDVDKNPKAVTGVKFIEDEIFPSRNIDPTIDLGLIVTDNDNALTIDLAIQETIKITVNVTPPSGSFTQGFFAKFRMNVVLTDQATTDVYYLKREIDYPAQQTSASHWTTTQSGSGFEFLVGRLSQKARQNPTTGSTIFGLHPLHTNKTITTPKIPVNGNVSITFDFVEYVYQYTGATLTLNSSNKSIHEIEVKNVTTKHGDILNQSTNVSCINSNTDLRSSIIYSLDSIPIFNGLGERGSLLRHSTIGALNLFFPLLNYREGNSGSYIEISKFVCQQFLRLMDTPVNKYEGQFFSNHDFRDVLVFDSRNWVQLGGTFTANNEQWSNECFVISKATITSSFDDGTFPSDLFLDRNRSFDGGFSAGNIDAIDANFEGIMSTNSGIKTTINAITGNDDSSAQSTTILNNMNFVTFGSGTGSYAINLPTAVGNDGIQLRFTTDATISASHVAVLTPVGSQTIDGASTFSLNRNFAGVTLMAYNSNLVVIQEKNAT